MQQHLRAEAKDLHRYPITDLPCARVTLLALASGRPSCSEPSLVLSAVILGVIAPPSLRNAIELLRVHHQRQRQRRRRNLSPTSQNRAASEQARHNEKPPRSPPASPGASASVAAPATSAPCVRASVLVRVLGNVLPLGRLGSLLLANASDTVGCLCRAAVVRSSTLQAHFRPSRLSHARAFPFLSTVRRFLKSSHPGACQTPQEATGRYSQAMRRAGEVWRAQTRSKATNALRSFIRTLTRRAHDAVAATAKTGIIHSESYTISPPPPPSVCFASLVSWRAGAAASPVALGPERACAETHAHRASQVEREA